MAKQFYSSNHDLYEIVDEVKKQVVLVPQRAYFGEFRLSARVTNPHTSEIYDIVGIKKGETFTYYGLGFEIIDEKNKEVALVDASSVSQEQFYIPKTVEYNSQTYTVTEIKGRLSESYYTREEDKRRKDGYTDWKNQPGYYLSFGIFEKLDWSYTHTSASFSYSSCKSIKEIIIPNTIKKIGFLAFRRCHAEKISIPNSVTSIGDSAFSMSSLLTSITIPDSVTSIGNSAFEDCSSLTSINIPDSVTSIGNYAFNRCCKLSQINISRNIKEIMCGMFQGCISLKEITIPSSVKGIHSKAFTKYWGNNGEMNLETVNIENEAGEVMIDSKAFESNTKINYLGKPKKEKTAPQSVSKKEEPKTAVTIDLEKLIAATLVDGVVTDKERAILCKKVKEAGGDVDEFEMLLDARIYEAQQKTRQAAPKAEPKKEEPKPASKKEEPKPAPKPEPKKEEPKPEPKPEPELETKEDSEAQEYNRAYWVDQSSEQNLELVDHILEIINSVCQFKYDLKYNKAYIGLALNGKPRVFVAFLPQKGDLRISIFVKQAPEFDKILAEKLDSADCYKTDQYKFHVQVEDTEKKGGFFAKLLGKTASNLDALKPLIIQAEKELR